MSVMRLGVVLPSSQDLASAARRIEDAGFASAWVFDSVGRGRLLPDPLTALAAAATTTARIELGTGVLQVPLRHPVTLARQVLTTQLVSGGRLRLGVGAGSTAADFAAVGMDFASRFRRLDESLGIMRTLWAGGRVGEAELGVPWPAVGGGPPILIGSWAGSRWIERAAREFAGWIGSGARSTWRLLADGISRFRDLGGTRAVVTNVVVRLEEQDASPDGPDDPCNLQCPTATARERLERLHALGFDDVVLVPRRHEADALRELRALW
jgi:alkanesulfonate monooxygenase SsuD/methylene tetrahydromethanopterin reductase-like flavin-dependent oxidoreductase (luciferase family)